MSKNRSIRVLGRTVEIDVQSEVDKVLRELSSAKSPAEVLNLVTHMQEENRRAEQRLHKALRRRIR